jgi:hypothetical protein
MISARKEEFMDESFLPAIGTLKSKISDRIAALQDDPTWQEIKKLYQGLGTLEELSGMEKTDLGALLGIAGEAGGTSGAFIGKYEFVADSPLEAAKKYLRKIATKQQKAASLDELMDALVRGGLSKINRDDLRISLGRSTTEIYKAGEDIYGLLESFPNVRRGSPGRKKGVQQGNGTEDKGETAKESVG